MYNIIYYIILPRLRSSSGGNLSSLSRNKKKHGEACPSANSKASQNKMRLRETLFTRWRGNHMAWSMQVYKRASKHGKDTCARVRQPYWSAYGATTAGPGPRESQKRSVTQGPGKIPTPVVQQASVSIEYQAARPTHIHARPRHIRKVDRLTPRAGLGVLLACLAGGLGCPGGLDTNTNN